MNAARSISGTYPNLGPLILVRGGVRLIDDVGPEIFDLLADGDEMRSPRAMFSKQGA